MSDLKKSIDRKVEELSQKIGETGGAGRLGR